MRAYFLGSGIIMALVYILAAVFVVRVVGIELTRNWSTALIAAAVLLGGTYGVVLFSFTGIHIIRNLLSRR